MKNLASQVWTYAIVTIVTLLVWLYAEDANIQEYTDQSLRLEFVVPEDVPGQLSQEGVTVRVDFNGSNGQYQQFLEETRGKIIPIQVPIDIEQDISALSMDIREQLELEVFGDLGINITSVTPPQLEITFEKIVERTLEIRVVPEPGEIKLSAFEIPTPDDRLVTIKLPAKQAIGLEGQFATASITQSDLADLEKGEPKQISVPITLPAGIPTQAASALEVDVLATVANDRATVELERLTIQLAYPPSINQRYIVEIDEGSRFLTAFKLEGPREQIEQIKADLTLPLVRASVWLTNAEVDKAAAEGGQLDKAVEIIAPPGVVPVDVPELVTIRVTPRETPVTP